MNGSSRFEKSFFLAKGLVKDKTNLDAGERIAVMRETFESVIERCHKYEMRQFDAMLCLLNMKFDPILSARVKAWLES